MNRYISELQEFIQKTHGVQSMHIDSVRVTQILEDNTVWDGTVEIFELHRHPKAPIVYAWAQGPNKPGMPRKYFAALHLNSVDSPEAAVKATIVQQRSTGEAA
jgi:acyl-CoA synthetase (NDP forming)